jgi:hypothetical protein
LLTYLTPVLLISVSCMDTKEEVESDPVVETAELYDFSAAAPWYQGVGLEFPPEATVVTAFDKADQYFGDTNLREIEIEVDFPESDDWSQVGMYFHLECPESGLCDHWDRSGSVQLVLDPESDNPTTVELLRHITPYRMEMEQYIDLTPMASLLKGRQTLRSFIDTWVGPGHSNGDGWRVTTQFVFYPGEKATADQVINIWGKSNVTVGQLEAGSTIADQISEITFNISDNANKVEAHLITTGHSFGNSYNCAEFCEMQHDLLINQETFSTNPWRNDCEENPVSDQYGTWEYNRNGWCPGGVAVGDIIDITDAVQPGDNTLNFDILLSSGNVYNNTSPGDYLPYTIYSLKLYVYE